MMCRARASPALRTMPMPAYCTTSMPIRTPSYAKLGLPASETRVWERKQARQVAALDEARTHGDGPTSVQQRQRRSAQSGAAGGEAEDAAHTGHRFADGEQ